ncbi:cupin domain-containing protein [Bradyrhizobium guangdongense]|uniref:Oxalate decarboxylase n=1 Tax=Bradyrhizobium guangdongense TaxID=1325090 RepID=A0A410VAC3_9BRAD|nr:cupin domain-containing protein [Bradyrhizobium guangdongense]QAU40594.1 oxalate decarboxylase [Bradyrhizobium guangdongense]QOZ61655.1 oxalate decarboxylase [Bradyrhizobium guangdongense]GGI22142.1 oxalate decarboxylase OxdD [Bradyrhizobium guangdongense]
MLKSSRRLFIQSLAFGAGVLGAAKSALAAPDGHAAGYDVAPASEFLKTIPRKSGDPVVFTASLDKGPIKATSGGWAREVTARTLPLATGIAGAHLFVNAGGAREMHWHNSAEWAYVVDGHCQVTVVDPEGQLEVVNLAPGDLWFFPRGHSHAIQTLGSSPCHAILAFDDGLYSEHGTFGISDWMSRYDAPTLSQALGVSTETFSPNPKAETYIMQGEVLALDGPQAKVARALDRDRTHRFPLMAQKPRVSTAGGQLYVASAKEFPVSSTMTGTVLKLKPGAMHEPHWHTNANEWHYVLKGRTRVTLFAFDKRVAVAELSAGECAYIPANCGHSIQNIDKDDAEMVGVLDSGTYHESSLGDWLAKAPRHLLANNFGVAEAAVANFGRKRMVIASAA